MKKNNMKMSTGVILSLLGGILYQTFEGSDIFILIALGGMSIALIYDLYIKNKNKIYAFEQNVALVAVIILALLVAIFKAAEDKLINLNMDFKVFILGFGILLSILMFSAVVYVHKTRSKKEARSFSIIAGITIICVGLLVVMAFAWT